MRSVLESDGSDREFLIANAKLGVENTADSAKEILCDVELSSVSVLVDDFDFDAPYTIEAKWLN